MIPVYNRVTYLENTLRSVLSQDPGAEEMQIGVVDDASSLGDSEELVRRVGGERVEFVRQPRRLGGIGNWNSCIERSRGEWVHILHSDDVVFSGFYQSLKAGLERRDDVGAAFCRHAYIDENGRWGGISPLESPTPSILVGFLGKISVGQRIQCPSIVVRRSVYEKLGGFRTDLSYAADWEMWVRVAAHSPVWYEPSTLAAFRAHTTSWSADFLKSAQNVAEERRCIAVMRELLPSDQAETLARKARENVARRALSGAYQALVKGEFTAARGQLREGLKCSASPRVVGMTILWLPVWVASDVMHGTFTAGKRLDLTGAGIGS
jgi:glycosyltransferase involved in cell wall biosynthesis